MRVLAALPVALAVSACDPALDPAVAVSQFNGASVTVSSPGTTALMKPQAHHIAKAVEVCPNARYISTTRSGPTTVEFLFAC